jgi:ferric-dicitrate binding protein FerR (iron transport regulator)
MFLRNKTDWSLLAKYMAGEATENEIQTVKDWMKDNPGNRALFNEINTDWKMMDTMNSRFSVDDAWNKLHNRIVANDGTIHNPTAITQRNRFLTPLRVAATLLLLAVVGVSLVYVTGRMQKINVTTASNEKDRLVSLPDGSKVYLNESTTFSYTKHFGKQSREVELNGEAFFEVSPDKEKPFVIFAGNARVKVLGTSFNVDTRQDNEGIEVFVSTGVVELSEIDNHNNRVLLHPGNVGLVNHKIITMRESKNENCMAWKTGILDFSETRLADVTSLLNEVYHVNIVIRQPGVDTTLIDGSYQNDPLDEILRVICKQNHLAIAKSDDTIYLSR